MGLQAGRCSRGERSRRSPQGGTAAGATRVLADAPFEIGPELDTRRVDLIQGGETGPRAPARDAVHQTTKASNLCARASASICSNTNTGRRFAAPLTVSSYHRTIV
jgi:hypothetical protein